MISNNAFLCPIFSFAYLILREKITNYVPTNAVYNTIFHPSCYLTGWGIWLLEKEMIVNKFQI